MIAQFKKIRLAVALGASALAMASPADAQRYGGYRGRGNGETAVIAGVAGLAIGAALASSARRDDGYYYDRGYEAPIVAYPQGYGGYYEGGYRGYDSYRGGYDYRGYDGYHGHRGGYDRGRGYDHGGRDGYRR